MKRKLLAAPLLILLTLSAVSCFSQEQVTAVQKGRILTADGKKIYFRSLTIGENSHQYRSSSNTLQQISADNTVRIEKQTGNEALKWGLITGLVGLAGSTLGALQAQNDVNSWGYKTTTINVAPIIAGVTVVSGIIGAVVGATKKKYKTVYTNPKFKTGLIQHLNLDLAFNTRSTGVVLRYHF